jgi:hypothetical protein
MARHADSGHVPAEFAPTDVVILECRLTCLAACAADRILGFQATQTLLATIFAVSFLSHGTVSS